MVIFHATSGIETSFPGNSRTHLKSAMALSYDTLSLSNIANLKTRYTKQVQAVSSLPNRNEDATNGDNLRSKKVKSTRI